MTSRLITISCIALLASGLGFAPEAEAARKKKDDYYKLQITPFVGYRFFGSFEDEETGEDYDLENDSSYGLIVNFPSKRNTEWEIYYSKQSTEIKTGDLFQSTKVLDVDVEYLQIGGTYLFEPEPAGIPYFVATIGAARFDPQGAGTSSETYFAFAAGGGWKYFPNKRVGLRLDGRFIGTLIDSDSNIFCHSGPEGSGCLVQTKSDVLWQFEIQAGVTFRF
ncbi:MAG: hypothetical protein ACR2QG_04690 [Gammaproteobacteria bacterium]